MNPRTFVLPCVKNLTQEPPRSPRERIGEYNIMARMIDKGRATLNGTNGEYQFDCAVDNLLFSFKGVEAGDVRKVLMSGAADDDVADWFERNGTKRTTAEIAAWSAAMEKFSYSDVPEKTQWFTDECQRIGLDPAITTLFDYLEADDRATFHQFRPSSDLHP